MIGIIETIRAPREAGLKKENEMKAKHRADHARTERDCKTDHSPRLRSSHTALGLLALATMAGLISVTALADESLKDKGIGPTTDLKLEALDPKLATQGKSLFETKCSACHKVDSRYVGPNLADVTKRRSPEWIMNMIMNPAEMTQKNTIAQDLLGEYLVQMPFQNVTKDETRAILEYLRDPSAVKDKKAAKQNKK
jgi:cytochrome c2